MLVGLGPNRSISDANGANISLRPQRLTLVGAEHVGKSALVDIQCGRKFGATATSTRFVHEDRYTIQRIPVNMDTMRRATKKVKDKNKNKSDKTSRIVELAQEVVVSDTVGQHESIEFAHQSIQLSKSVFLCFAVDDLMSMLVLYTRRGNYFGTRSDHRPAYFLIGTKRDRLLDPVYVSSEISHINLAESTLNSRGKTRGRDRWAYASTNADNESGHSKTDTRVQQQQQQQLHGAATMMPYMPLLIDWDAYLSEAWVKLPVRHGPHRASNPTVLATHVDKDAKTLHDTRAGNDNDNDGNIDSGEGGGNHRDGDVSATSIRSLSDDEFMKLATVHATDGVEWNGITVYPPTACSLMACDIALKSKELARQVREIRYMFFKTFATRALPFSFTDQQYRVAVRFYSMFPVPEDVARDFMHFYNELTRLDDSVTQPVNENGRVRVADLGLDGETDEHVNIKELVYTSALLDFAAATAGKKMPGVHYIFNTMISKYMQFEAVETDRSAGMRKGTISIHRSTEPRLGSKSKSWCVII